MVGAIVVVGLLLVFDSRKPWHSIMSSGHSTTEGFEAGDYAKRVD